MAVMLSESRKSVVNSSRLGNVENERTLLMYIEVTMRITAPVRFVARRTSSTSGGTGMIIRETISTTANARKTSLYFAPRRTTR